MQPERAGIAQSRCGLSEGCNQQHAQYSGRGFCGGSIMLPAMEFRNRTGGRLNLSTVDTREEVSTAKLCHVVDVGEGVWCRPCQSADCAHAEQAERVLRAAGLGNELTADTEQCVRLPQIEHITQYRAIRETIAACWFENGARLRYHEQDDGSVRRVVFGPGDPQKPAETTMLPTAASAKSCLVNALTEYCDYCQEGNLTGLQREQPALAIVVGSTESELDGCQAP
jgi:hypothetical protein